MKNKQKLPFWVWFLVCWIAFLVSGWGVRLAWNALIPVTHWSPLDYAQGLWLLFLVSTFGFVFRKGIFPDQPSQ